MRRFQLQPYDEQTEINFSPMLDVVFILLIFFIVVATFIRETGLPVALPGTSDLEPETTSINVIVDTNGIFSINGRVTAAAGVSSYVQALYSESPDASYAVLVKPGSRVGDAALAIDAGRRIGVDVVPIAALD